MALMDQIRDRSARVGVIGLGYVGLPLAVTAARRGFPVTGFDVDPTKIDRIAARDSYIDAVTAQAMDEACEAGLRATTDFSALAECRVILICVPTPLDRQREPDLSYVENTARTIAAHIRPDTLVVLESTTWPGTTEEVLGPILAQSGLALGQDIFIGFSPEREDPGIPPSTPPRSPRSWPVRAIWPATWPRLSMPASSIPSCGCPRPRPPRR